ncbi:hypothetical protein C5167_029223 [Papaver somniferum]|nr:hypothetical protein C5167_029223 [Papaver somniferum]
MDNPSPFQLNGFESFSQCWRQWMSQWRWFVVLAVVVMVVDVVGVVG